MPPKKKVPKVEDNSEIDPLDAKFDALEQKLISTISKAMKADADVEEDEPNPLQAKLDAGATIFRTLLKTSVDQKKLDTWDYDKLLTAMELQGEITPVGNPIPAKPKTDAQKEKPQWLRTVVH